MLANRIWFLLSTSLWLGCGHMAGVKKTNALPPQLFAENQVVKPKPSEFRLGQLAQSELKALLAGLHAGSKVPGVGVGIVFGRQVVWTGVFGYAELENKAPMTADSVTRIGSLSKVFTGLAILSLRDQGRLDLDMPVAKVVPELAQVIYPSKDSPRITFRHLLTHTSGLPRLGDLDYYSKPDKPITVADLADVLKGAKLRFSPGTDRLYSNLAMGVASVAVDRLAGMPLRDFLKVNLFKQLNMTRSTFDPKAARALGLATGYAASPTGPKPAPPWAFGVVEGLGGMYSTLNDMTRFLAWQTNAWPARNTPDTGFISRSTLRASQASLGGGGKDTVGANWYVGQHRRFGPKVSHTGATQTYSAHMTAFPQSGIAVVTLANMGLDPNANAPPVVVRLADQAIEWLEKTIPQPALTHSKGLNHAMSVFKSTYAQPTEAAIISAFHKTFLASLPAPKIIAMFTGMKSQLGVCPMTPKKVMSATQAVFTYACAKTNLDVMLVIEPTEPHQIIGLSIKPASP